MKSVKTSPEEYLLNIASIWDIRMLSDLEVDRYINLLLTLIPNNCHLYKYRNFKGKTFLYTYNSIKKGNFYLPQVSLMNDKIDTTFLYKNLYTYQDLLDYHKNNKYQIASFYYSEHCKKNNVKIDLKFLKTLRLLGDKTDIVETIRKVGCDYKSLQTIHRAMKYANNFINDQRVIKQFFASYENLDNEIRNNFCVYCLSESYDQDSMWAYYGDNNKGFCIEYDFNKIVTLPHAIKRKFLTTFKILYKSKREQLDIIKLYDYVYSTIKSYKKYCESNILAMKSMMTKSKSWKHENEWRIVGTIQENIIGADLVSKIIIDEDALKEARIEKRVYKLIQLAKSKTIPIVVRVLNTKTLSFKYVLYEKFLKLQHPDN